MARPWPGRLAAGSLPRCHQGKRCQVPPAAPAHVKARPLIENDVCEVYPPLRQGSTIPTAQFALLAGGNELASAKEQPIHPIRASRLALNGPGRAEQQIPIFIKIWGRYLPCRHQSFTVRRQSLRMSDDYSGADLSRRQMIVAGTTGLLSATAAGPSRAAARGRSEPADGTPEQIHLTWGDDPTSDRGGVVGVGGPGGAAPGAHRPACHRRRGTRLYRRAERHHRVDVPRAGGRAAPRRHLRLRGHRRQRLERRRPVQRARSAPRPRAVPASGSPASATLPRRTPHGPAPTARPPTRWARWRPSSRCST